MGCGRIGRRHAELLAQERILGARLASVCDIDSTAAAGFGEKYSVPWYVDLNKMLSLEQPDLVVVATPSGDHALTARILLMHRTPLLVEKPLALRLTDAEELVRDFEQSGVPLFVVKQNRYNLPIQAAREALTGGHLGRVLLGTVRVRWSRDGTYYSSAPWRGTWEMDGGVIANQASHHLDILTHFLGPASRVFAWGRTQRHAIDVEDTAVASLDFESHALGAFEATTATYPVDTEGSLSLICEHGTIVIGGFALNRIDLWEVPGLPLASETVSALAENPPNVYGFGHERALQAVVNDLTADEIGVQGVTGRSGLDSMYLIHALYSSIETGLPVDLAKRPTSARLGVRR